MRRIRSAEQDFKAPGQWTMEGFLYVQEKREYSLIINDKSENDESSVPYY